MDRKNKEKQALDDLVAEASALLSQTEAGLAHLADKAFAAYEQLQATAENGDGAANEPVAQRIQYIGQQFTSLSQLSSYAQHYLENGLDTPPPSQEHWPRIKILRSQEEERTQLARELEDSVGQLLANAVFELASCRHLLASGSDSVSEGLDALQQELEQGLADIRHLITELEPASIVGSVGLGGGIRRYLEQFESRTNIAAHLRIGTNLGRLPATVEIAIFRVVQEALQNISRHANAGQVTVEITESNGLFEFTVIDNGDGMTSDRVDVSKKNFGLARMVDYADLVSGKLRIFSEPGQGTRVTLSVPYHAM